MDDEGRDLGKGPSRLKTVAAALLGILALTGCQREDKTGVAVEPLIYQHAREAPHVLAPTPLEPGHNYSY